MKDNANPNLLGKRVAEKPLQWTSSVPNKHCRPAGLSPEEKSHKWPGVARLYTMPTEESTHDPEVVLAEPQEDQIIETDEKDFDKAADF